MGIFLENMRSAEGNFDIMGKGSIRLLPDNQVIARKDGAYNVFTINRVNSLNELERLVYD